jgi:GAF domain-containing protein
MYDRGASVAGQETVVARLTRERDEALQQQNASSEVLNVISRSPGELQPVFDTILQEATRVCQANFGLMIQYEEGSPHPIAFCGVPQAYVELAERGGTLSEHAPAARAARTKQTVHVADFTKEYAYAVERHPMAVAGAEIAGIRTLLVVPMLKEGDLIGNISIYRQEVRPFTDKQIALVQNFAAQAVIAIENARLLNELRQRTADLSESLEQQTATSDVLKVISSSPGDLEPVFQAMLANATRICEAKFGILYRCEEDALRTVAMHNAPQPFIEARRSNPIIRPNPHTTLGRAVTTKQPVQIANILEELDPLDNRAAQLPKLADARTVLAVPMLKENELIGAFLIYRTEVRPFADKQIELIQNFAAQAVIAIENARLLSELRESLDRQTATADILRVIASTPEDSKHALDTIAETASHMFGVANVNFRRIDGDVLRIVSSAGPTTERLRKALPDIRLEATDPAVRCFLDNRQIPVEDRQAVLTNERGAIAAALRELPVRSQVFTPLSREGKAIGVMIVTRGEVQPFQQSDLDLMKGFADQAVIAIENARLLNELRESLDRQTATSEVLSVISSSPGELNPVFDAMLENAIRICDAKFGHMLLFDGEAFTVAAMKDTPAGFANFLLSEPKAHRPYPGSYLAQLVEARKTVHVPDAKADKPYVDGQPRAVAGVDLGGFRTLLLVPMIKEGDLVGSIHIYRLEVRPFADKQIDLVKNFAAQAVIAIENARLLNELRQSLEQQTASADVLRVISSSRGELEPVFQTILQNAMQICEAKFGMFFHYDRSAFHTTAALGVPPAYAEYLRGRAHVLSEHPHNPLTRVASTKEVLLVPDAREYQPYIERNPRMVALVELAGARTLVTVPLLKDGELIGAMTVYRQEVRPFTDKQIELLQNFAAQAVIAIENARLLNDLNRLNQQLEHRVADQVGEIERMGRLRRFLPPQVADLIVASGTEKQLESHRREITALFCDLRGFTGFSESSDPEDVMALLAEYPCSHRDDHQ